MSDTAVVSIRLMGKKFNICCEAHEVAELEESMEFLSQRLQSIASTSSDASLERAAVITALNLAHELLFNTQKPELANHNTQEKLLHLIDKIDNAIADEQPIENTPTQTSFEISELSEELARES